MFCPIVELTKNLIKCRSISPNDAGCQDILIEHLDALGFYIEPINVKDTKNFWATRGKKGQTLAFAGHTDVVPPGSLKDWKTPPFEPIIRNGMLFGRGAADMKGSLAAMVIAAERFVDIHPYHRGRLAFIITSDEEASAKNGTTKVIDLLMSRAERIDYCILGEPSSTEIIGDVIKNGRRGSITANLKLYGIQSHVAYAKSFNNPIHRAIPILNELLSITWDKGNDFFPPTTIQITNISAGIGVNNVTPNDIYIQFNCRFNTEVTVQKIQNNIIKLLNSHQIKFDIKWSITACPFITLKRTLVDIATSSILKINNIQARLMTTGGTSDGRFINRMGAEILEIGPVNASIHQVNECVKISDLHILSLIYQNIMERMIV